MHLSVFSLLMEETLFRSLQFVYTIIKMTFLIAAILRGEMSSQCSFSLISLMTGDIRHFPYVYWPFVFNHLRNICSSNKPIYCLGCLISCLFSEYFVYSILTDVNSPSNGYFAKIFLHCVSCLLHSVNFFFARQKIFIRMVF